jgi:hypothetical protein
VIWRCRFAWCLAAIALVCGFTEPHALSQQHTIAEQYLFQSINTERLAVGLQPLVWNPVLTGAAYAHAQRMRSAGEISHQFRGEPDVAARAAAVGAQFSRIAENVAVSNSVLDMHAALMRSPGHRENILDPKVNSVAIVVVASGAELWAVEDFARDMQSLSLDQQELQVANLIAQTGLGNVSASRTARETCRLSTGFVGERPAFVMRYTASDLGRLPAQLTTRIAQGGVTQATVGACLPQEKSSFTSYSIAVVLYR